MPNWNNLFSSTMPFLEVVVRATLLYLGVVLLLRIVGQREAGGVMTTDLVVVLLITSAVGHSMTIDHLSIPQGLVMAATMLAWSVVLDAIGYRFPRVGRWLKARPRPLIEDGVVNQRALRRELLSRDELDEQLRLHGVEDLSEVRRAYLEPNGMISVLTERGESRTTPAVPSALK